MTIDRVLTLFCFFFHSLAFSRFLYYYYRKTKRTQRTSEKVRDLFFAAYLHVPFSRIESILLGGIGDLLSMRMWREHFACRLIGVRFTEEILTFIDLVRTFVAIAILDHCIDYENNENDASAQSGDK